MTDWFAITYSRSSGDSQSIGRGRLLTTGNRTKAASSVKRVDSSQWNGDGWTMQLSLFVLVLVEHLLNQLDQRVQ